MESFRIKTEKSLKKTSPFGAMSPSLLNSYKNDEFRNWVCNNTEELQTFLMLGQREIVKSTKDQHENNELNSQLLTVVKLEEIILKIATEQNYND